MSIQSTVNNLIFSRDIIFSPYLRIEIRMLSKILNPEDPIRSVDPIVFNRIRVGFRRKPTSFIKKRSDPTWFLSGSYRSESGSDLVGFHRVPSNSDEIRAGFRPIGIRQKPYRIRHKLFKSDRIRPPMNLLGT
jgi:hypothetical protein